VGALLAPRRTGELAGNRATCRAQEALAAAGQIVVTTSPKTLEEQLDALWAVAQLAWRDATLRTGSALDVLDLVP
jgi:hypothetical protein